MLDANTGAPTYVTCIGGGLGEVGEAVAVDLVGNAYIAGRTYSSASTVPPFPATAGVVQEDGAAGGLSDAFLLKMNPGAQGTADLVYASYLGGTGTDEV